MAKIFCKKCGTENDGELRQVFLEDPERVFDAARVSDLARAIRRGDAGEAEYHLDRLLGDHDVVRHWIEVGRASA